MKLWGFGIIVGVRDRWVVNMINLEISERAPVIFVGHGSPMNAIESNKFSENWKSIGEKINKPKAIIVFSAHWYTEGQFVRTANNNRQIFDMYEFPDELYQVEYNPPGHREIAFQALRCIGSDAAENNDWGLDHGVWSVLCNMFPMQDVPVVNISVDSNKSMNEYFQLGRKIRGMRDDNIMILASGNIVHNLSLLDWSVRGGYPWAENFEKNIINFVEFRDIDKIINYTQYYEDYEKAIPTLEHYVPLIIAMGATYGTEDVITWNEGCELGSISMTSFRWG